MRTLSRYAPHVSNELRETVYPFRPRSAIRVFGKLSAILEIEKVVRARIE